MKQTATNNENCDSPRILEMQRKYREALATFSPQINPHSPNYIKAIEWMKANGYSFTKDISYNGYIYFEKLICDKDSKIEIQIYDGIIKDSLPCIEILNLEADFGNIMDETKYFYKRQSVLLDPLSLDELFEMALQTEQKWEAEWEIIKSKM